MKGGFRECYFNWGFILFGGGVLFFVSGVLNIYLRMGKFFLGFYFYVGVGMVLFILLFVYCFVVVF